MLVVVELEHLDHLLVHAVLRPLRVALELSHEPPLLRMRTRDRDESTLRGEKPRQEKWDVIKIKAAYLHVLIFWGGKEVSAELYVCSEQLLGHDNEN